MHRAAKNNDAKNGFLFPSYVEDVMGPICFDYGYGPFRYVALSRKHDDLKQLDAAAMEAIELRREQDRDNYAWIRDADKNRLVVGTQARILYADASTRVRIALRFNELVKSGAVGPVYISRDHHDCASTDSPFRETANIKDGSNIMSEMAHHSWAGNAARGMTMCVLSNGGGVGTGKAYNGGFGLVLDGTPRVDNIVRCAMDFDVMLGVARYLFIFTVCFSKNVFVHRTLFFFVKKDAHGRATRMQSILQQSGMKRTVILVTFLYQIWSIHHCWKTFPFDGAKLIKQSLLLKKQVFIFTMRTVE